MSSVTVDDIDWNDTMGKEARGLGDEDLWKAQEIHGDIVVTKSWIIGKKVYIIPKSLLIQQGITDTPFRVSVNLDSNYF